MGAIAPLAIIEIRSVQPGSNSIPDLRLLGEVIAGIERRILRKLLALDGF